MDLHLGAQLSPLLLPHLAAPRELCFRSLQLQGLRVLLCELLRLLLCLLPLRPRLLRLMLLPGLDLIQRHAGMRLLLLLLLLRLLLLLLLRLLRLRLLPHLPRRCVRGSLQSGGGAVWGQSISVHLGPSRSISGHIGSSGGGRTICEGA